MIDGHIHFHSQPYTLELLNKMIKVAQEKGITELYLLDHTHKFYEFDFLYSNLKEKHTVAWFYNIETKVKTHLQQYISFIEEMRKHKWPIKIHFGLEVCYFKDKINQFLKVLDSLKPFNFDFLIGSIHYVNNVAVDLCKEIYLECNVDEFYKQYLSYSSFFQRDGQAQLIIIYIIIL